MEYEPIFENEEGDMVTSSPIITNIDMRIKEREEIEDFRSKMEGRITLDVRGRHFATSRKTLLKDPNSIFISCCRMTDPIILLTGMELISDIF